MGVARKWHFSTSGGAANLGGVSGDLSELRGSRITLLGITSLNRHFYALIDWTKHCTMYIVQCTYILLTKITAVQNEAALSYHRVRGQYFIAVVFASTIIDNK